VLAITKDAEGVSRLSGSAAGNEQHAEVISGLFRSSVIPQLLDRQHELPPKTKAILLVEGTTDHRFIELAKARLGLKRSLESIAILPCTGGDSLVVEAIVRRAEAVYPIWALLDSDADGRKARDMLRGRFKFPKPDLLEYATFLNGLQDAESEWMFPASLLQRFVDESGEDAVLKRKEQLGGEYRYDFLPRGKAELPDWLEKNALVEDLERWRPLLEALQARLTTATTVGTEP
jgi:putative ATP-dependent endonuclease of OLD family